MRDEATEMLDRLQPVVNAFDDASARGFGPSLCNWRKPAFAFRLLPSVDLPALGGADGQQIFNWRKSRANKTDPSPSFHSFFIITCRRSSVDGFVL